MSQQYRNIYITSGMKEVIAEIIKETGMSLKYFSTKTVELFLSGRQKIDPCILLTERSHPNYVRRDKAWKMYVDDKLFEQILEVAKENDCSYAVVLFQALYDYCIYIKSNG